MYVLNDFHIKPRRITCISQDIYGTMRKHQLFIHVYVAKGTVIENKKIRPTLSLYRSAKLFFPQLKENFSIVLEMLCLRLMSETE